MEVMSGVEYETKRVHALGTGLWPGGRTTELFIYPPGSECGARNFDLRLSSAAVELDESEFSDFSGYVRSIMPLEGRIRLLHNGEEVSLAPFESYTFDGGQATRSFGRCVDFNLIHKPGWSGEVCALSNHGTRACRGDGFAGLYALCDGVSVEAAENGGITHRTTLNSGDFFLVTCPGADDLCEVTVHSGGGAKVIAVIGAARRTVTA